MEFISDDDVLPDGNIHYRRNMEPLDESNYFVIENIHSMSYFANTDTIVFLHFTNNKFQCSTVSIRAATSGISPKDWAFAHARFNASAADEAIEGQQRWQRGERRRLAKGARR